MKKKSNIDFSVFIEPNIAYGNIAGLMEFTRSFVPGDMFFFNSDECSKTSPMINGFNGSLRVESVVPGKEMGVADVVMLEDVVLVSVGDAERLMDHMESVYGLFASRYDTGE